MPSISQSLRYVFFLAECPCGLEFLRSVLVLDLHVSEPVLHRTMLELVHRSVVFYPLLLFHDVTIGRFYDLQFRVGLGGTSDDPEANLRLPVLPKNDAGLIGRKKPPR